MAEGSKIQLFIKVRLALGLGCSRCGPLVPWPKSRIGNPKKSLKTVPAANQIVGEPIS